MNYLTNMTFSLEIQMRYQLLIKFFRTMSPLWRRWCQHEQHLAICRFRAVELRRSIIRAVNMGISGVIDPDGRVIALPGDDWAKSKKMDGVVSDRIPLTDRRSLYPRIGDFFAILCLMTVVFALVLTRRTDIRPSNP